MVTTLHTIIATKCYEVSVSPKAAAQFIYFPHIGNILLP
jgi:hypothetical protein